MNYSFLDKVGDGDKMANPAVAALISVAKNIVIDIIKEPEKIIKIIIIGIVGITFFIVILAMPVVVFTSFPTLIFSGDETIPKEQLEKIDQYKDAPEIINHELLDWVEEKKDEYTWCDSIRVNYNFDVKWQELMAIDSVKLKQDFTKAKNSKILALCRAFTKKKTKVETYKVRVSYTVTDSEGNKKTKHRWETRHRAIITVSTKSYETVINNMGFDEIESSIASNIYEQLVALPSSITSEIDLSELKEYPPGEANIIYYSQMDKRWAAENYGKYGSIGVDGCGPTSLAMVIASYKDPDITPVEVAKWSFENNYFVEGSGSKWNLIPAAARHYGFNVDSVSRDNPDKVIEALSRGYPVIAIMGRGHFTSSGHFIVLRGLDKNGNILVNDPYSYSKTKKAWKPEIVLGEASTKRGLGGTTYWVLKP